MASFTVKSASVKKTFEDKPAKVFQCVLQADGAEPITAEYYNAPGSWQLPEVGSTLDATVTMGEYGWKFKPAGATGGGGGGGGFRGRSPEELEIERARQRAIALEASQKVALDLVDRAIQHDMTANDLLQRVEMVTDRLYARVLKAIEPPK